MLFGPAGTVSNQATWRESVRVRDIETHDLIDLTDHQIQIEIAEEFIPGCRGRTWARASTDDGSIAILDVGVFEFVFPAATMRGLPQGDYAIGVSLAFLDETAQLAIGSIRVLDGIVRTVQTGGDDVWDVPSGDIWT